MENLQRIQKDWAISAIRLIAVLMIISCHIFQYFGSELAWWLNAGVQIFLFISGFLYGRKNITDDIRFITKTFRKILLDYYVYLILMTCVYLFFWREYLDPKTLICAFTCSGTILGMGHLWYIPYILLCYLITPMLFHLSEKIKNLSDFSYYSCVCFTAMFVQIILYLFGGYFVPSFINCYILGFFLAKRLNGSIETYLTVPRLSIAVLPVCTVIVSIKIYLTYFSSNDSLTSSTLYNIFSQYTHLCLGGTIFLWLYRGFSKLDFTKTNWLQKLLSITDQYSYDIYITHHIFILGPFAFLSLTGSIGFNIALSLALTAISSICLHSLCRLLSKFAHTLQNHRKKLLTPSLQP